MKSKKLVATILVFLSATIAYAGLAGLLTRESRDWAFIQAIGGMKVSARGGALMVDCDVSGLRKVTVEPTMINSGMEVRKLKHKRVGRTIQLSLVTSVLEKGMTTTCKPLDLSDYPAGEYTVQYLDRDGAAHDLGKITLGAASNAGLKPAR